MNQRAPLLTSEPPHAEAIAKWEAFWRLEDLGRPLWQIPTPPAEALFEAQLVPMLPLIQDKAFESHVEFIEHIFRTADHSRGLSILVTPPTLTTEAVGTGPSLGVGPHVVDDEFVGHFVQTTKETMERCSAVDRQRSR